VATAEDQATFARAKDAYNVLSKPSRKAVYDRYGANGFKWTEDPTTIDPNVRPSVRPPPHPSCRLSLPPLPSAPGLRRFRSHQHASL
jgi:curved DNA-binding protein CbpA